MNNFIAQRSPSTAARSPQASPEQAEIRSKARASDDATLRIRTKIMRRMRFLIGMAFIGAALSFEPAAAQVAQQTVAIAKVDVTKLAAGYRASKVIGSSVTNDKNETIGTIEDLLVSPDGKEPFAVLSVGGFLGMGSHLVAVPFESLKVVDKKLVLPGGTKDGLRMLPEFKYAGE